MIMAMRFTTVLIATSCIRFYFRISTPEIDFEPDYKCSKCRRTLIRVNEIKSEGKIVLTDKTGKTIEWTCPHCGSGKLTSDMIIMWD